jgi:Zn-finger nucleic acid-binding protein
MNDRPLTCPACQAKELFQVRVKVGLIHACKSCGGKFIGLGLLQKVSDPALMGEIWREARKAGLASGRICPLCARTLFHARIPDLNEPTELDLCEECTHFWFDSSELEKLPRATPAEVRERSEPSARNINPPPVYSRTDFTEAEYRYLRRKGSGGTSLVLFLAIAKLLITLVK